MRKLIFCSLICFAFSASAYQMEKLKVSKGTRQGYGGLTLNYGQPYGTPFAPPTFANAQLSGSMMLSGGYFVADDLSLVLSAAGSTGFGSPQVMGNIMVGFGLMYVFENDSPIYPYLQAQVTGAYAAPAPAGPAPLPQFWAVGVQPQIGILMAFNKNVALDIGVQANMSWGLGAGAPAGMLFTSSLGIIGARISI